MNKQKTFHWILNIGVVLKGIHGLIEVISGTILLLVTSSWIVGLIIKIFNYELIEDPTDFLANAAINSLHNLPFRVIHFVAVYLLIFGIINIILAVSVLTGKLKGYLLAIGIIIVSINNLSD